MPELVAAFRRPIAPRAVSHLEQGLCALGARVDDLMVRVWMRSDRASPWTDAGLADHLRRAAAFYADPAFLADPTRFFVTPEPPATLDETELGRFRDGACLDLRWPSGFVPVFPDARQDFLRFAENHVGHARWWRHDRPRPTVVCLHGYASGDPRIDGLAFGVRRLYRAGLDVLLYTLPFHGRRRPRGVRKSGAAFFAPDLSRTNEAFAQVIYEVRALLRHVEHRSGAPVGAFGMSLGAYATALLAAVEPRLAFAVAMIPVASLPELVWGEPIHRHRRQEVEAQGITLARFRELWQVHAPLLRRPLVPRERRFVIGALGDRICPPGHAHALWQHWEEPQVHWYPGGHLAQFRRGRALGEVRRFLGALGLAA